MLADLTRSKNPHVVTLIPENHENLILIVVRHCDNVTKEIWPIFIWSLISVEGLQRISGETRGYPVGLGSRANTLTFCVNLRDAFDVEVRARAFCSDILTGSFKEERCQE